MESKQMKMTVMVGVVTLHPASFFKWTLSGRKKRASLCDASHNIAVKGRLRRGK